MKRIEVEQLVVDKVKSNKRVSRIYPGFEEDLKYYLEIVELINTLERNETQFQGVPFEKIELVKVLSGFVLPNSVTISGNKSENDFLIRQDSNLETKLDVDRMSNFVSAFYGMFKMQPEQCTVADVRVDLAISASEVKQRFSFEGSVVTDEPVDIPVPISIKVFRDRMYGFNEDEVTREWLVQAFRKLSN